MLPSATEILFALGAADDLVGVTFECDYPPEARAKTVVSTSTLPEGLDAAGIDAAVSAALAAGEDLYRLDTAALAALEPDLVVTQALCAVCAVDRSVVDRALGELGENTRVVTLDPHTLDEVMGTYTTLGEATGREEEAAALVADQRFKLATVMRWSLMRSRPRVMFLEWTDPPFAPGHWIPEMIELAGGEPVLGRRGEASYRTTWADIRAADPEVVVVGPCGFDRAGAEAYAAEVRRSGEVPGARVVAVDANASWARPGTRLADGVAELATLLHK